MAAKKRAAKAVKTTAGLKSARGGSLVPYGPPIWDAKARGDISEMKAVAEAARRALFPTKFTAVKGEKEAEAKRALAELEAAIAKLERRR